MLQARSAARSARAAQGFARADPENPRGWWQHLEEVVPAASPTSRQSLPGLQGQMAGRGWTPLLAIMMVFSLSSPIWG